MIFPDSHSPSGTCPNIAGCGWQHEHAALCKHVRAAELAASPLSSGFWAGGKTYLGRTALDTVAVTW